MKIITTIHDLNNLEKLFTLADGFLLGDNKFGTRLCSSFSQIQINEFAQKAQSLNKEVFLLLNQMMTDEQIDELKDYLSLINTNLMAGFIIADIGLVKAFIELNLVNKLIYNPSTLLTNYFDFNYLAKDGLLGGFVANEIELKDIEIIGKKRQIKTFMIGHGYVNMFYSKRKLATNYAKFLGIKDISASNYDLKLIEEQRDDEAYPFLQDQAGSHVFRSNIFSCIDDIKSIKKAIDYIVVDTIFLSDDYAFDVLEMFKNPKVMTLEKLKSKYYQTIDDGFLHKPTIYKGKT